MQIPNWLHEKYPEHWKNKYLMVFWWGWCAECQDAYLECPKCHNNSCNAGYGTLYDFAGKIYTYQNRPEIAISLLENPDTKDLVEVINCDVCSLATQYETLARQTNNYPKSAEEVDTYNQAILDTMSGNLKLSDLNEQ